MTYFYKELIFTALKLLKSDYLCYPEIEKDLSIRFS